MSEADQVPGLRVGTLAGWIGGAVSLALVLGAGVWTWRLMERETAGVPVIRAEQGPMRVAPEKPGGDRAAHQGLSVSHVAAREGEVSLADRLRLAPRGADLAAADMPPDPDAVAATDLAVAEALGLDTAVLIPASAQIAARPAPRPAPRLRKVDIAATAPSGGEAIQLGAFPTEARAAAGWVDLVTRFPDLLDGTERRLERVERGGRTFWRLRAGGFADLADARRVCAALAAGAAECVPVVRR
jgi:hypothetical protein